MSLGLVHLLADFFGGKGKVKELAYLYSLSTLGLFPLTFLFSLAIYLPVPMLVYACVFSLIGLAISIYGFFLLYHILKVVYGLEKMKAVAVIIIEFIIATALSLAITFGAFLYGAALFGTAAN
ncbi:MAG: YIP1 family protein [Candidatus Micrarchaeota archaeon]